MLCKRKLTSFEDFSAGGFYLFGFSFFLLVSFSQNTIDFSGGFFFCLFINVSLMR